MSDKKTGNIFRDQLALYALSVHQFFFAVFCQPHINLTLGHYPARDYGVYSDIIWA
jgi:hypothetical protein